MSVTLFDMYNAARYLGIGVATLRTHRHRGSFPDPFDRFGRTPVWSLEQLDEWQAKRPGKPGRPRVSERVEGGGAEAAGQVNFPGGTGRENEPRKDEA